MTIETDNYRSISQQEFARKTQKAFFEVVAGKVGSAEVPIILPARPTPTTLTFIGAHGLLGSGGVLNEGKFIWDETTKLFTALDDMFAITVEMTIRATWGQNITIGAGIAVGNPLTLPNDQGVTQNDTYVSRFADVQTGRGTGRPNTFKLNYSLVGKAAEDPDEIGVFAGDNIFPVFWNYESTQQTINVIDMIVSIKNTIV